MTETSVVLANILEYIADKFKDEILKHGRNHVSMNIGDVCEVMGIKTGAELYHHVNVLVPLKQAPEDSLVEIVHGADISNHRQTATGLVVPEWIAKISGLCHQPYQPGRYMILHL